MKTDYITGAKILNREEILLLLDISSSKFNRLVNRDGNTIKMPVQKGLNGKWWAYRDKLIEWKETYDSGQHESTQYARPRPRSITTRPTNSHYITRTSRGAIVIGLDSVPTEVK